MSIIRDNDTNSSELEATIIEPLLSSCLESVTFNNLLSKIQKTLQISSRELKNYLFYLIEYGVISYDGKEKVYTIEKGGLDLLYEIKKEETQGKTSICDITITFEYA